MGRIHPKNLRSPKAPQAETQKAQVGKGTRPDVPGGFPDYSFPHTEGPKR